MWAGARAAIKDSEGAQPRDGGEPSPAGNSSQATARERGDRPPVGWPRLEGHSCLGLARVQEHKCLRNAAPTPTSCECLPVV